MRNNLVTILHCADCGKPLELAYEKDGPARPDTSSLKMSPCLPTGGEMLPNRISVKPCRYCKERITGPAVRLKQAIADLGELDA